MKDRMGRPTKYLKRVPDEDNSKNERKAVKI